MNIHCVNKAVLTIQKVGLNTCQQLHVGDCTTPHPEFYSLGFSGYARVYIYIHQYIYSFTRRNCFQGCVSSMQCQQSCLT